VAGPAANPLWPGFEHFYNNEYDQALAFFQEQSRKHPEDPAVQNAIAQTVLYREMFRDGALESELVTSSNAFLRRPKMQVSAENRALSLGATERAIALAEKQGKNARAVYAIAVAHGLRANFFFLVEKSWTRALHEIIAARRADDEALKLDPNFTEARMLHGIGEYVVGCLPAYMRILGALNGFHGDKEGGIRELERVFHSDAMNRYDAAILLTAVYRREHRPKDALPLLDVLARTFPRNYLFPFEKVQMYSDLGDKESALRVLNEIETAIRTRQPGYANLPMERVEYARGNLLFWYRDPDGALDNLQRATRGAHLLDPNTAVMAWLRLGQVYDLKNDHRRAIEAYQTAMKTAPKSPPAKEAEAYIDKPYRRKPAAS
jgi:tetratricopeptide (TPR) repeat protein